MYKFLTVLRNDPQFEDTIFISIKNVLSDLEYAKYNISIFRSILLISFIESLYSLSKYREIFCNLVDFVFKNLEEPLFFNWYSKMEKKSFQFFVQNLQTFISLEIMQLKKNSKLIFEVASWLNILQKVNIQNRIIHYKEFYNDAFNNDNNFFKSELKKYLFNKKDNIQNSLPSVIYFSWMLNPATKVDFI